MRYTHGMRSRRGSVLGTVIMVIGLALLAAMVVASSATFSLTAVQRIGNGQTASNLAESAVNQAMAKLMDDPKACPEIHLADVSGLPKGAEGVITFDRSQPFFSTNNFTGKSPQGWHRTVPTGCVQLVAMGRCNGVVRHIEVLAHIPTFPTALGVSGQLTLTDSLVGGVDKGEVGWSNGQVTYDPSKLKPGDVASDNDKVLTVGANTTVTGNVQARGGVVKAPSATIDGEVRSPWSAAPLPKISVEDYDPSKRDDIFYQTLTPPAAGYDTLNLTGVSLVKGNFVANGPVTLDNAVLFVKGDLTVSGGLSGLGAVFVTGNVTLLGGASLTTDDTMALIAGGNVTMRGTDRNKNTFCGMVYTGGTLDLEHITLLGTFIQNSDNPDATAVIKHCNILYSATRADPQFFFPVALATKSISPISDAGASDIVDQPLGPLHVFSGNAGGGSINPWQVVLQPHPSAPPGHTNAWSGADEGLIFVQRRHGQTTFTYVWRGRYPPDRGGGPLPHRSSVTWTGEHDLLYGSGVAGQNNQLGLPEALVYGLPDGGDYPDGGYRHFFSKSLGDKTVRKIQKNLANTITTLNRLLKQHGGDWSVNISFDPNVFLNQADTLRVLMWREF